MLIPLIRIVSTGRDFSLSQIFVNVSQIIYIQEDLNFKRKLKEGIVSLDLHQSTGFSRIKLDNGGLTEEVVVVGEPEIIKAKIDSHHYKFKKALLQG